MTSASDAGSTQAADPRPHDVPATPAGLIAVLSAEAGVATLVISFILPWYEVTKAVTMPYLVPTPPAEVTSWARYPLGAVYPWDVVTILLVPLLLLPALALVVSTLRSLRRGGSPTGAAVALSIVGVGTTGIYAFLLLLASYPWFAFIPGHTVTTVVTPALGLWVALAGSILALAGVIAARIIGRRRNA